MVVMMVTMLSVNLSACRSDDDDDDASGVVGTWVSKYGSTVETIVFKADKSGTWNIHSERYDDTDTFTYSPVSNTEGTMAIIEGKGSGEVDYMYYVVKGNKLHIYESYEDSRRDDNDYSEVFTRQ